MPQDTPNEKPLQSWKEIAAYLDRDVRTATRWERDTGLPVRRYGQGKGSSVYAYPSEIEAWRARRPLQAGASHDNESLLTTGASFYRWSLSAIAVVVLLGGFALFLRSPSLDSVAEAGADSVGVRITEICRACDTAGEVSPDGLFLSETDWVRSGEIGIRDLTTGELRRLGKKSSWAESIGEAHISVFSPDGKQIAYNWLVARDEALGYEMRTIGRSGESSDHKTVYFNPELGYIMPRGWTRDGRILVWLQRNDWSAALGFIDIASGELSVVKSTQGEGANAVLSHDDRWIAYESPDRPGQYARDIYLLGADGSEEKRVTTDAADDFAMGFTPDSKTLLFASNRTGSYGLWGADLSESGPVGAKRILMRDIGPVERMGVTRDGALVYARGIGSIDLFKAELDLKTGQLLGTPRLIKTGRQGTNSGPWLSRDGSRFAYVTSPQAAKISFRHRSFRVHETESGREREVALDGFEVVTYEGFDWSQDGKRILAQARDRQNRWNLCDINAKTGAVKVLLGESEKQLHLVGWSAGDREVIYHYRADQIREGASEPLKVRTIAAIQPGTTTPRTIYSVRDRSITAVSLSPKRDRLAWVETVSREVDRPELVKVMSVDGGEARTVLPDRPTTNQRIRRIAWAKDGRSLLLESLIYSKDSSEGKVEVWIVSLDGSAPRKSELDEPHLRNLAVHPDGKTVLFQAGNIDVRAFKMENFLPSSGTVSE